MICKELNVIMKANNVAHEWGKYLHDIISKERRTIAVKNKGVACRRIIKLCSFYLDYLIIIICEAIAGDMNTTRGKQRIMKVFDYQVNREKGNMIKILDLICTEAHVNHSLYCQVNGALQKTLLIEIVLE